MEKGKFLSSILIALAFVVLGTTAARAQEKPKDNGALTDKNATASETKDAGRAKSDITDMVFTAYPENPTFPGGLDSLRSYIRNTIHYPETTPRLEGKVVVSFFVECDGSVGDIKVVDSLSPVYDQEAVRTVSLMPKWKPATLAGKPVRTPLRIPIAFKLPPESGMTPIRGRATTF